MKEDILKLLKKDKWELINEILDLNEQLECEDLGRNQFEEKCEKFFDNWIKSKITGGK